MSYCRLLLTPRMTLLIVIGSLIYSVGLNQFIVPVGLYKWGIFRYCPAHTTLHGKLVRYQFWQYQYRRYFIFYFEYTVAGGFRETFWEGISC